MKTEYKLNQVGALLAKLRTEMKEAVDEAYTRGWDDGIATTPDYKKFHESHKVPQYYGEDGEIVVVSGKYGMEEAVDKIYELLKDDYDATRDDVWSNTHAGKIALGTTDDECDYYASADRNGIFDAWIWRA